MKQNKNNEFVSLNNKHRVHIFNKALEQLKGSEKSIDYKVNNLSDLVSCGDIPECRKLILDFIADLQVNLINKHSTSTSKVENSLEALAHLNQIKYHLQVLNMDQEISI